MNAAEERERELKMMQSPGDWPVWPWLPVKNRETGATGVLLEEMMDAPIKPIIRLGNVFAMPKDPETITYGSFEDLIAAGWIVD